jgi:C4-dicarboxylate transporter, DctM subunit
MVGSPDDVDGRRSATMRTERPVTVEIVIVLVLLFVGIAVRLPIALALALAGGTGLILVDGYDIATASFGRVPIQGAARFTLIVIPMFILMGVAARHARIAEDAFSLLSWVLRKIPGGLALATVGACAAFAAVSGSSVAAIVSIGKMAIVEMRRYGHALSVAAGVVGAAGTLGVLIPPSIPLVLYAILAGESVGALLLAGVVPGLLSAVMYGGAIVLRAKRNPEAFGGDREALAALERPSISAGLFSSSRVAILLLIVVGGIYFGFFTAIEASAAGAIAAVLMMVGVWIRQPRQLAARFRETIRESVELNGMIFALLIGGLIFSTFTVAAGIPRAFTSWATDLPVPGYMIIALVLLALIPLGMFLDGLTIMLIVVPLTYPLVTSLGMDGVWFGILFVKFIEVGLITPPLGVNAYVVAATTPDLTVESSFRGVLAYLPIDLLTIAIIFAFPATVTFLPDLMRT